MQRADRDARLQGDVDENCSFTPSSGFRSYFMFRDRSQLIVGTVVECEAFWSQVPDERLRPNLKPSLQVIKQPPEHECGGTWC